jgi:hypothetical protein
MKSRPAATQTHAHERGIEFLGIDRDGCMRMLAAASGGVDPGVKTHWVRIRATSASGRRIVHDINYY